MSKYNITNGKKKAILKLLLNLQTIQEERSEKKNWGEYTVGDSPQTKQDKIDLEQDKIDVKQDKIDLEQDKIDLEQDKIGVKHDKIRDDGKYYYNIRTKQIKYERPEIMKTTYQEYEYIEMIAKTQILSFIENLNFDELKVISKDIQKEIDRRIKNQKKLFTPFSIEIDKEDEENFETLLKTQLETLLKTQLETRRKIKANDSRKEKEEKEEKPKKEEPPTIYFQKSNKIIGINRELKPGEVWESLGNGMFGGKKWEKVFTKQVSDVTAEKVMVNEGHIRLRNEDAISNDKNAISNELNIDREIRRNLQIVQQKIYKLDTQKNDGKKRLEDIQKTIWEEMQRILKPGTQIKLGKGTEGDISKKVAKLLGDTHWNLFRPRLEEELSEQELLQLKRMINYVNPELLIDKDEQTQDILKIKKGFQISSSGVARAATQQYTLPHTSGQNETKERGMGTARVVLLEAPNTQGRLEIGRREQEQEQERLERLRQKRLEQEQELERQERLRQKRLELEEQEHREQEQETLERRDRRQTIFDSKLNEAGLTLGMSFPYFDLDDNKFVEEVQIIGKEYDEKEQKWKLKLSLDTDFDIFEDIDYVIAGFLEGRTRKQKLELFNSEFKRANLKLNEPFPYYDTYQLGFQKNVELTEKYYSSTERKWKLVLTFYNEEGYIIEKYEAVVEDIANVIEGKKKGSEIEQKKEEFLEEVYENDLQIGAKVSFDVENETLEGKVDGFVWDEEKWKLRLVDDVNNPVEYKTTIERILEMRKDIEERLKQEQEQEQERQERDIQRQAREEAFDSKLKKAGLTIDDTEYDEPFPDEPFPYFDSYYDKFEKEVRITGKEYNEKEQKWKLVLTFYGEKENVEVVEDIAVVIAGKEKGSEMAPSAPPADDEEDLFDQNNEWDNEDDDDDYVSSNVGEDHDGEDLFGWDDNGDSVKYVGEETLDTRLDQGAKDAIDLTGKDLDAWDDDDDGVLGAWDGQTRDDFLDQISKDAIELSSDDDEATDDSEVEIQEQDQDDLESRYPWDDELSLNGDDEPEYKEQDGDDSILSLSDNDSEVEIVDERKREDELRRGAATAIILSDDEEVEIVDDALPDGVSSRNAVDLTGEGQGLQALTFGLPGYNTKIIRYIGKVPRFQGETGKINYMKKRSRKPFIQWYASPEIPGLKYSGRVIRIHFKVTWDNAQLRESDQSQFNREEFDYLMANLSEEMLELKAGSEARSSRKSRLIPIDELNFQKEMYNKDTSTLVVAEASASKPSPVSIPSGELSAMLAELSSMDYTESEYASESEVEEPLETGWKSDDFASSDFASESGDNSSELSN